MDSQSKKWYSPILDWLKTNGGNYILGLIAQYGGSWVKTTFSGFWGTVILLAYKYIALPIVKKAQRYLKASSEAEKKEEAYNEIVKKPDATHEDLIKAGDDFFTRP